MIEVYRHADFARVSLRQGLLEEAGIRSLVRNAHADANLVGIPMPSLQPNLCVFSEADAELARVLIADFEEAEASSNEEPPWICANCGEESEGNYFACWSCGAER